jgi:hypothetical protein
MGGDQDDVVFIPMSAFRRACSAAKGEVRAGAHLRQRRVAGGDPARQEIDAAARRAAHQADQKTFLDQHHGG